MKIRKIVLFPLVVIGRIIQIVSAIIVVPLWVASWLIEFAIDEAFQQSGQTDTKDSVEFQTEV